MATNGKVKSTYSIIYGDLPYEAAEGVLTPVVIGPRYEIHKDASGYSDSYIGRYVYDAAIRPVNYKLADSVELPARNPDSKLDYDSLKLVATNMYVALGAGVTGTKVTDSVNKITTTVDLAAAGLSRLPAIGDKVYVSGSTGSSNKTVAASIVGLEPTYTFKAPQIMLPNATTPPSSFKFTVTKAGTDTVAVSRIITYTVYVKAVSLSSDNQTVESVTIEVKCLDNGRVATYVLTSANSNVTLTEISPYKLALNFTNLKAADISVGTAFTVSYGSVESAVLKNLTVNTDLSEFTGTLNLLIAGSVDVVAEYISSAYWALSDDKISLSPELLDAQGRKVTECDLAVYYRELIVDYAGTPTLSTAANISDVVGIADPDNPLGLAYAVYAKAVNAYGPAGCFFLPVSEDSDKGYADAVAKLGKYTDIYALVPLRGYGTSVDKDFTDFITSKSDKAVGEFKTGWFASELSGKERLTVVNAAGSELKDVTALADGTSTISLIEGDAARSGVKSGDIVSIHFGGDYSTGSASTVEFEVESVVSGSAIKLKRSTPSACKGLYRITILRPLSSEEFADVSIAAAKRINSHRVKYIVADQLNFDTFENVDKYYAAVSNATIRAALPPHAPLTDVILPGFSITETFTISDADMNRMDEGGVWVLYNTTTGEVRNYHQTTTKVDGKVSEEDSVVANTDSIIREIQGATRELSSGSSNASDKILKSIEGKIHAVMTAIAAEDYGDKYGPRFESYEVVKLIRPDSNRQRIKCRTRIVTTLPLSDSEYEFAIM